MFGELAAMGASASWAISAALFGRVGDDLDAFSLAALQCIVVAAVMSVVMAATGTPAYWGLFELPDLGYLAASGLAGLVVGEIVYFRALNRLGPRLSLLIWSLSPGATVAAALVWLGQVPTVGALVGIVVTVAGILVTLVGRRRPPETRFRADTKVDVNGPELLESEVPVDWYAVAAALFGPLFMGVSFAALGGVRASDAPLAAHTLRFAAASVPLVAIVAATGRTRSLVEGLRDWSRTLLLLAAVGSGTLLGSGLATYAVLATDPATAMTLSSLGPVFILPISRLTESKPLLPVAVFGAVVAVVGAGIVAYA